MFIRLAENPIVALIGCYFRAKYQKGTAANHRLLMDLSAVNGKRLSRRKEEPENERENLREVPN